MPIKAQKWPNTLIVVRHGESERNARKADSKRQREAIYWAPDLGRDQDTPLTERGKKQAQYTAEYIDLSYQINALIVSPYLRTMQTANAFISRHDQNPTKIVIEERIREIEFGVLDGLTAKGIREKYPEEWKRKQREGKYFYRAPGGESRPDLRLRIHSFLGTLARDYVGQNVVIYTHSVPVLVFRSLLERWDEKRYLEVDKEHDVENCSITVYTADAAGKLKLSCFNQCPWEGR